MDISQSTLDMKDGYSKKVIGILGGMGPAATADFYRRIIAATYASHDQEHLHILIDSYPQVPDRSSYLLDKGTSPVPYLITMAQRLERAGADLLIIACNTANIFIDKVSSTVSIPVLNWVELAMYECRTSFPSIQTLGLLATTGTIMSGLYQFASASLGFHLVTLPPLAQEEVMQAIYGSDGIKAGPRDLAIAHQHISNAGWILQQSGAQGILLACTELSILLSVAPFEWLVPTLDATQFVAEQLVAIAGGQIKLA